MTPYGCCKGLAQKLSGVNQPTGACQKNREVWITTASGEMYEYINAGTTPVSTLTGGTLGCAVDKQTGNLAAVSGSTVSVWPDASGTPTSYTLNGVALRYCGYDTSSNLFVDGLDGSGAFVLAELPQGGTSLQEIPTSLTIGKPGNVQWDGTYMAVQDLASPYNIYRLQVTTSGATVVGQLSLGGMNLRSVGTVLNIIADSIAIVAVNWDGHPSLLEFSYPYVQPYQLFKLRTKGPLLGIAISGH
jgi:hypothetical protein